MIGVLATAVKVSLSVKYGSDVHGNQNKSAKREQAKNRIIVVVRNYLRDGKEQEK